MTISTRIKKFRVCHGLTHNQRSSKLNMNQAYFSHYERDAAILPSEVLTEGDIRLIRAIIKDMCGGF